MLAVISGEWGHLLGPGSGHVLPVVSSLHPPPAPRLEGLTRERDMPAPDPVVAFLSVRLPGGQQRVSGPAGGHRRGVLRATACSGSRCLIRLTNPALMPVTAIDLMTFQAGPGTSCTARRTRDDWAANTEAARRCSASGGRAPRPPGKMLSQCSRSSAHPSNSHTVGPSLRARPSPEHFPPSSHRIEPATTARFNRNPYHCGTSPWSSCAGLGWSRQSRNQTRRSRL